MSRRVVVIGAGLSGAACATELHRHGMDVGVLERGRAPGGRLASPDLHGRRVDLGAAYFTVRDAGFRDLVERWQEAGVARAWTDTFDVAGPGGIERSTTGPMRWAAPSGLRSMARSVLDGLDVRLGRAVSNVDASTCRVDGELADVVVLAMPDPQTARLLGDDPGFAPVGFEPTIAVAAGWPERCWPFADAAFVHDDPDVTFVADDGARRGDGAPVLVAHSTPALAGRHLDDPQAAVVPVLAALRRVFGVDVSPQWTHAHRWTFAKPGDQHAMPFARVAERVFVCGDSWCPDGAPRVESAWLSGLAAARGALAALGESPAAR